MPFRRFFDRGAKETPNPPLTHRLRPSTTPSRTTRRRSRSSTPRATTPTGARARWRAPHRCVDGQQARRGALRFAPTPIGPTHFSQAVGCSRRRRRRQRVRRLHDGARLRRARIRRAERHARRRRCDRVGQRVGAVELSRSRTRRAVVRRHPVRRSRAVSEDRRRGDGRGRAHRAHVHGARHRDWLRLFRLARLVRRRHRRRSRGNTRARSSRSVRRHRRARGGGERTRDRSSRRSCSSRSSSGCRRRSGSRARASSRRRPAPC